ncbi:MAG: hypothetical protein ABJG15_17540 [Hyphomonadaceae bacterium]
MKRVLAVLGVAGFIAGALYTPPAEAGPAEDQFFQMDRSRDGTISRSEFTAFQIANGSSERSANFAFENLKGDDNAISLTEYRDGPSTTRNAPTRLQRRDTSQQSGQRSRSNSSQSSRRPSGGSFGGGGGGS